MNLRPLDPQSSALPAALHPEIYNSKLSGGYDLRLKTYVIFFTARVYYHIFNCFASDFLIFFAFFLNFRNFSLKMRRKRFFTCLFTFNILE